MAQISPRVQAALGRHGLSVALFEQALKERNWTPARVAVLKALIPEEFTLQEAADALGKTSRGAVGGKVARLGLSNGLTRAEVDAQAAKTRARKTELMRQSRARARGPAYQPVFAPRQAEAATFEPQIPGPAGGVSLLALGRRDCRYPLKGAADTDSNAMRLFCGAPNAREFGQQQPYCARHQRLCAASNETVAEAERRKGRAQNHVNRGRCETVFGHGQSKGWARA
jgi:hypothetical protein